LFEFVHQTAPYLLEAENIVLLKFVDKHVSKTLMLELARMHFALRAYRQEHRVVTEDSNGVWFAEVYLVADMLN
jgi:hypothetical protein